MDLSTAGEKQTEIFCHADIASVIGYKNRSEHFIQYLFNLLSRITTNLENHNKYRKDKLHQLLERVIKFKFLYDYPYFSCFFTINFINKNAKASHCNRVIINAAFHLAVENLNPAQHFLIKFHLILGNSSFHLYWSL